MKNAFRKLCLVPPFLLIAGCSLGPTFDVYEGDLSCQGQPARDARLVISNADNGPEGFFGLDLGGDTEFQVFEIEDIEIDGDNMDFDFSDGTANAELRFDGDELTGDFETEGTTCDIDLEKVE